MNITNRLYAYPVLSEETDDYNESSFDVVMDRNMHGVEEITFDFRFMLDSKTIKELIDNRVAEYMIHMECSHTAFRRVIRSRASVTSTEVHLKKVSGKVEFVAFVVLKKDLKNFQSDEWSEDFEGLNINLPKGSILAYKNLESLIITKDFEEFTNPNSIISVIKVHNDVPIPATINLESQHIQIQMYEKDYDNYVRMAKNPKTQQAVNMATVLPALVYAFDEIKNEDNYDKYSGRNWLISLEKSYLSRGLDLKDELASEKSGYVIAQEALDMPICKIYENIHELTLTESEEED